MNAERLKIGDQVVVRSVSEFAKNFVKRGDRARVAEVLKDGKKVQYRFRFDGYNNLGRKSRNPILLPRKLFARAETRVPQYAKGGRVPPRPAKAPRVPRPPKTAETPLQALHACRALMELLIDKLSVLETRNGACPPALPGLQLPQELA